MRSEGINNSNLEETTTFNVMMAIWRQDDGDLDRSRTTKERDSTMDNLGQSRTRESPRIDDLEEMSVDRN